MVIRHQRGFTLLEVLVALTIVAIAMGALIKVGGSQASNASYLRDRTLSHWVGMNVVASYQLAEDWPATGRFQGEEEMANHRWFWRAEISETFDVDVRRLDVMIRAQAHSDAPTISQLVAFLPRPSSNAAAGLPPTAEDAP
ncbi:MAG: type II secretion system minor pseudopilin GspI [Thiohalomonadaceae bacterium]